MNSNVTGAGDDVQKNYCHESIIIRLVTRGTIRYSSYFPGREIQYICHSVDTCDDTGAKAGLSSCIQVISPRYRRRQIRIPEPSHKGTYQ